MLGQQWFPKIRGEPYREKMAKVRNTEILHNCVNHFLSGTFSLLHKTSPTSPTITVHIWLNEIVSTESSYNGSTAIIPDLGESQAGTPNSCKYALFSKVNKSEIFSSPAAVSLCITETRNHGRRYSQTVGSGGKLHDLSREPVLNRSIFFTLVWTEKVHLLL